MMSIGHLLHIHTRILTKIKSFLKQQDSKENEATNVLSTRAGVDGC